MLLVLLILLLLILLPGGFWFSHWLFILAFVVLVLVAIDYAGGGRRF